MTVPRPTLSLKSRQATAPAEAPAPAKQPELLPSHFWFNFREGGSRPRVRHATRELAFAEAERLRGICPGATILTYEARLISEPPQR